MESCKKWLPTKLINAEFDNEDFVVPSKLGFLKKKVLGKLSLALKANQKNLSFCDN